MGYKAGGVVAITLQEMHSATSKGGQVYMSAPSAQ